MVEQVGEVGGVMENFMSEEKDFEVHPLWEWEPFGSRGRERWTETSYVFKVEKGSSGDLTERRVCC